MGSFASGTTVSQEKSRQEIETLLVKSGASRFGCITDIVDRRAMIGFTYQGLQIQMEVPLPDPAARAFTHDHRHCRRSETKAAELYQAEMRRRWRCLALALKAKLVAVGDGVTTFEREFLSYVVAADGNTIGEKLMPVLEHAKNGGGMVPASLALPPGGGA